MRGRVIGWWPHVSEIHCGSGAPRRSWLGPRGPLNSMTVPQPGQCTSSMAFQQFVRPGRWRPEHAAAAIGVIFATVR
jgi:hypothetical protein